MLIKLSKSLLILTCVSFVLRIFAHTVYAQTPKITQVLRVNPVIINSSLSPGKQNIYKIQVTNLLNEGLGIHAELANYLASEDTQTPLAVSHSPLTSWSNISPQDITIDPKSTKVITLFVVPPRNAKNSGYYEVVYITPFYSKTPNAAGPSILSKIGVLFLGNIGAINYNNLKQKVSIEAFSLGNMFYEQTPVVSTFELRNNYFTHFDAKPFLTITPLFGSPKTYTLPDKHILPGTTRLFAEQLNIASTKHFFYNVDLAVSVGNGEQIYAHSFFFLFPIRHALLYGGIFCIIVVLYLGRRRLKKAWDILTRNAMKPLDN